MLIDAVAVAVAEACYLPIAKKGFSPHERKDSCSDAARVAVVPFAGILCGSGEDGFSRLGR